MAIDNIFKDQVTTGISSPNLIAGFRGYHLSYNDHDIDIYGDVTTAIVIGDQMDYFLILNGDHRKQLLDASHSGLTACLDYFNTHLDIANNYSDHKRFFSDQLVINKD